jgi:excinuclease ABC subunit B
MERDRDEILHKLVEIQYERNDYDFVRGNFRVRGDIVEIYPVSYTEKAVRVEFFGNTIERITEIDVLNGEILGERSHIAIYPASHFITTPENMTVAIESIKQELELRLKFLKETNKLLEAQRLEQRTRYDIEMLQEMGYCPGIENYSRHLTQREPGQTPNTLLDYFPDDFLLVIDESHVTLPQVRGMYHGDRSRKDTLVEYGFRLPSAYDNRPLFFEEFEDHINQVIYVSATPGPYERTNSNQIVEQIIRPTGLVDPDVVVKPVKGQIDDLLEEIRARVRNHDRVLVTTLTKRMAEDLTEYLKGAGVKVNYLHSEIHTLERMQIIRDLRLGKFDVLVGINLLREGLDLPEVSLVAILDADKEGFLRSDTSLIQTIGRAARHIDGKVIMYADKITDSMQRAIQETTRRRDIQLEFNRQYHIEPQSIQKAVRDVLEATRMVSEDPTAYLPEIPLHQMPKKALRELAVNLQKDMKKAARSLEFEKAAQLRDMLFEIEGLVSGRLRQDNN